MAAAPVADDVDKALEGMALGRDGKPLPEHEFKYEPAAVAAGGARVDGEEPVIASGSENETVTAEQFHKINAKASKGYAIWYKNLNPADLCIKWNTKERPPVVMAPNADDLAKRDKQIAANAEKKARHTTKIEREKKKRDKGEKSDHTDDEFSDDEIDEVDDADLRYEAPKFNAEGKEVLDFSMPDDAFAKTGFRVNKVFKENTLFVAPFLRAQKVITGLGEWDSIKKNRNSQYAPKGFDDGRHVIMLGITGIDPEHQTSNGWDPTAVDFDKWSTECNYNGAKWIRKTGMRPKLFNKIAHEIRTEALAARLKDLAQKKSDAASDLEGKKISQNRYEKILRKIARREKWSQRVDTEEVHRRFAKRFLPSAVITTAEGRISGDPADKMIIFAANNTIQYSKEEFLKLTPATCPPPPNRLTQNPLQLLNSVLFHRRIVGQLPYRLFLPNIIIAKTGRKIDPAVDLVSWLNVVIGQNDIVAPVGFFDYNFNSPTCRTRYAFTEMIYHSRGVSTFGQRRFRDRSAELNHVAFDDADDGPRCLASEPFDMGVVLKIEAEVASSDTKKSELAASRNQKDTASEIRAALKLKWDEDAKTKLLKPPAAPTAEESTAAAARIVEQRALAAKKKKEFEEKAAANKRKASEAAAAASPKRARADVDVPTTTPVASPTPSQPPPLTRRSRSRSQSPDESSRRRERSPLPASPRVQTAPIAAAAAAASDDDDDGETVFVPPPAPVESPKKKSHKPKTKAAPPTTSKKRPAVISDDDE